MSVKDATEHTIDVDRLFEGFENRKVRFGTG